MRATTSRTERSWRHARGVIAGACEEALLRSAVVAIALVLTGAAAVSTCAAQGRSPEIGSSRDPGRPLIVITPLREVEPPRNVPATEWKSPYCATWDDGCTECTRKTLRRKPVCKQVDHYTGGGTCKPRGIVCAAPIERGGYTELERVCAEWNYVTIVRPETHWSVPVARFVTGFVYDKKARRWTSHSQGMLLSGRTPQERRANEERFARRVISATGRNPDGEFELTSQDSVLTFLCMLAYKPLGATDVEKPDWFELMGESRP